MKGKEEMNSLRFDPYNTDKYDDDARYDRACEDYADDESEEDD